MVRDESPLTFAGRTIGIGVCAPALLAPAVRDGGLAPVAVAAVVAALVGVPAAQAEWRSAAADRPGLRAAMSATAHLAGLLLVSAAVAPAVRSAGVTGFVLAAIGWGIAVAVADRPRVVWWVALGLVVAAVVRAVASVATVSVGTLLTPQWGAWELWLGPALAGGLVAAGVGTGQWTVGPRRVPGHDETPWAVAGAAVVLATALALQAGARFESSLGVTTEDAGAAALVALAGWLGAAVVVGRPEAGDRSARPARAAFGTLATWWLAGPAAGGVALVLHAVVPASAALLLLGVVWSTRGSRASPRSVLALSAALGCAFVAVATSAPALPDELGTGVAAGLLLAAAFWVVATRVALALREAP
jgi:hypothetical protein